jgi:uncharacterized protein YndB with AHSA1/START domain
MSLRLPAAVLAAAVQTAVAAPVPAAPPGADPWAGKVKTGRTIVLEETIAVPPAAAFGLWTTEEGLRAFFAPASRIEARPGGAYTVIFDPVGDPEGASKGTKGARILAFQPPSRLAFEWTMPPFAAHLNVRPLPTWVEIDFADAPGAAGRTLVRLRHEGFKEGADWDRARDYFHSAWSRVLSRLKAHCAPKGEIAMSDMPQPGDEHRRLEALAGDWTAEETLHPSPWDPKGGPAVGRIRARMDLDGFFLVTDYVQERGGRTSYRGHGVFGWDSGERCYTMHWFDSLGSGGTPPAKGRFEGNVLTFSHQHPMGHSRYVYTLEGEGRYSFRIENSQNGRAWSTFLEGKYARRK